MFPSITFWLKSMMPRRNRTSALKSAVADYQLDEYLSLSEIGAIQEAVDSLPGSWSVSETHFRDAYHQDGRLVGLDVRPVSNEGVARPSFSIWREGGQVMLATDWVDNEEYWSSFWSVPAALAAMRSIVQQARSEIELVS